MPSEDYNVAPTTFQAIIRQSRESGDRELVLACWGLVPFFTKELKDVKGLSTIDARAESIMRAPTWREPMKKRRCNIPANAFYEWVRPEKSSRQLSGVSLGRTCRPMSDPLSDAGRWSSILEITIAG